MSKSPVANALVSGLLALAAAGAAMAAEPAGAAGGLLTARAQLHEAYTDHPLVAEVRAAGYLTVVSRERALSRALPSDRALAVIDAVGAEGVARNAVDRFVTQAIQARLTIGPSGALKPQDIGLEDIVDARQALLLGWTRALAAGKDRTVLTRKANRLDQSGAIQLLEKAVELAPAAQASRLALAIAQLAAETVPRKQCERALGVLKAAREGGNEPVRLATAERAATLVAPLTKACKPAELAAFSAPIQLAPPVAEEPLAPPAERMAAPPAGLHGPGAHPFGVAFVITAPVFPSFLHAHQTIQRVAQRTRLDEVLLLDVLKTDPTGDIAIATLNASALMQRISVDDNADIAWATVGRRHGLLDAPKEKQKALKIKDLTGPEAMLLGYAYALKGQGLAVPPPPGDQAMTANPAQLFEHGKGLLPANAALGPIMAQAHTIDLERQSHLCLPLQRVDALRFVVGRSTLPEGARQALQQALATVEAQCKALPEDKPGVPAPGRPPAGR